MWAWRAPCWGDKQWFRTGVQKMFRSWDTISLKQKCYSFWLTTHETKGYHTQGALVFKSIISITGWMTQLVKNCGPLWSWVRCRFKFIDQLYDCLEPLSTICLAHAYGQHVNSFPLIHPSKYSDMDITLESSLLASVPFKCHTAPHWNTVTCPVCESKIGVSSKTNYTVHHFLNWFMTVWK